MTLSLPQNNNMLKSLTSFLTVLCLSFSGLATGIISAADLAKSEGVIFAEQGGLVAVEAEHFFKQTQDEVRKFYLTHSQLTPEKLPDGDRPHVSGASGGAYLEILPDTRRTHADKLIKGENFSQAPGKLAVLHYQVHFETPGRYYVWVRAHSTGTEDNGLHVGINGTWPESGQRLQWCQGKHSWRWESRQRTEQEHCGEPGRIFLEIKEAGIHTIQFSMREDGFEFDKWFMTTDRHFQRPSGIGPATAVHQGKPPKSFPFIHEQPAQQKVTSDSSNGSPTRPVSSEPLQIPRQPDGDGECHHQWWAESMA